MFGMRPDHVRGASRVSTKLKKHGVQAMLGAHACSQTFWTIFGTRCAGQIRDKSWPRKGRSLIFNHFLTIFRHSVQAMFGTHPGRDRNVTSFLSIFRQFLGHGVQAMFRTHLSHDRDGARFSGHVRDSSVSRQGYNLISMHFYAVSRARCAGHVLAAFVGTMFRPCPGRVLAEVGTHPDFQAFLDNFWDSMCRPCSGRVMATAVSGTRCAGSARDASGLWQGCSLVSKHFLVVFETRRVGYVQDAAGTHPDFYIFLGNFFNTVCKEFSRCVRAAARM
ncbi:Hypothetical predicted protein [Olea europaea subsp. europaea]|uniref:Uncharacterized protein n=1 Tax=Olea europaea subsp. europaea TaxID=158383 RepID=A0A8S0PPI8_OLEEU|nr:Hypothetical predicted protein [Olea europaea subsp. europaea]